MSLIRVRRQRKRDWIDVKKGQSPTRMILALVVVVGMIWYLTTRF